jgi:Spy/CpxP family protein refolding chaperone
MKRCIGLALIGMLVLAPSGMAAVDTFAALVVELNLSPDQIQQIREYFSQFAQKQAGLQTTLDIALQHREEIRQLITDPNFNSSKARQISEQFTAVAAQRMVNRIELRYQIFQVLTPQQRQQYIQTVEQDLAWLE